MNFNISRSDTLKFPQLLLLILAGESIFFLPFVLARVFRPTFLSVFEITNLELGSLFSVYGLVAMAAYFFGGPLADRFAPRTLLSTALVLTGLGGLLMANTQSLGYLSWLYAFWGITTILLFWAALIKATRILGGNDFQARAFGFLEGGRGFIAAFVSSVAVAVFTLYLPESNTTVSLEQQQEAFNKVILFFSFCVLTVGLLTWFFLDKASSTNTEKSKSISLRDISHIIKTPNIWYQAVIIVCAYVGYKITDDFSLLASEVLGYSEVEAAQVGALALWMRVITAVGAGLLADKIGATSRVVGWGFLLMVGSGLLLGSGALPASPSQYYLLVILTTCLGVYSVRGLYFALIEEAHIPKEITGASVGVISVIGFTPDVFMGPLMGYLLDGYPGAIGHQLVFLTLAGFALIGWLAVWGFRRTTS